MFTLIEHGAVYTPAPIGVQSVLICQDKIARIGPVDVTVLAALGLPYDRIDATGCIITPGFIDPHQHLIGAAHLHATHIGRSQELMDDAIAMARRGAYVDLDTVEADLSQWLRYYRGHGGPLSQLTVSSDAHTLNGSPRKFYQQFVASVGVEGLPLEDVLPLFTCNTARVLRLHSKGRVQVNMDADLLILDAATLAIVHVLARGRQLVRHGQVVRAEEGE